MAKKSFSVTCNACTFSKSAESEEQADIIAARHAAEVHRQSIAHHLAQHITIKETKSTSKKK
jgi:hypothetical protein